VNIPSEIRAGDTVKWRDDSSTDVFGNDIKSDEWTLTYYLRFNSASEAHTSVGSAYGTGWEFTISATDSAGFDAGTWYWQAIATKGSEKITLGYGSLEVEATLSYSGSATAYDGRSQAKKDLEAVQAAIRALATGGAVQEYKIGNRNLKRYDLADLFLLEGKLKAEVNREEMAEKIANGLGNPRNMFVRFN
jgi:hypothetical protein|tara:strand:+ start:2205 stop:2777 length:573 start_codon:yes stop_codon:yes gene_type:complete